MFVNSSCGWFVVWVLGKIRAFSPFLPFYSSQAAHFRIRWSKPKSWQRFEKKKKREALRGLGGLR
jgi:hypothetical protein